MAGPHHPELFFERGRRQNIDTALKIADVDVVWDPHSFILLIYITSTSMPTRLRQVALIAATLEDVVTTLTTTLDAPVVERDPGVGEFGLHNALIQLGDTFLEVVAPLPHIDPLSTAGGRYVSKYGNGGYMLLMQVDDLHAVETKLKDYKTIHSGGKSRALRGRSHTPLSPIPLTGITGTHYHPRDMGCLIEATESSPTKEWLWAGNEWHVKDPMGSSSTKSGSIARVEIACADPDTVSKRWEHSLSLIRRDGTNTMHSMKQNKSKLHHSLWTLWTVDGTQIDFRKPLHSGENGPVAIDLWSRSATVDNTSTIICGVIFRWVSPVRAAPLPPLTLAKL